ncbi:MAG: XdhC family protein [Rhodothermus sp.]|nr:XdhC family protein [Rhodothermus sp.]
MFDPILERAREQTAQGRPCALAIVVRYEAPISGKPGDKALILPDGTLHGWIGGGCTRPVVVREALRAMRDGRPRLVRITPEAAEVEVEGLIAYSMTCYSGGTLDVYIEPLLPPPQLLVLGHSAVAQATVRLGHVLRYRVLVADPEASAERFPEADLLHPSFALETLPLTPWTFAVVATQGEGDEEALTSVLAHPFPYVALVASRRKAARLRALLAERGVPADRLAAVRAPAGLNLGARTPEEIALSILAEIVQERHQHPIPVLPDKPTIPEGFLEITLHIEGMSCAHCLHTVEKTLQALPGVIVQAVELGRAEVAYDPDQITPSTLAEALEARGYHLRTTPLTAP